jgi:SAM-dependent methyltransferase
MEINWSTMAPHWDRRRADVEAMKTELTAQLLAGLEPLAGRRILELGAGTGELAAELARAAGARGSVLASDAAEGMVELLRARLADLPGVEVATIDATDIPLGSDSVDVVVFRMGLMLVPEPEQALREIHRVLRPGGRLAAAVWGGPQDNPWMTAVGMAAMMHGLVQGGPPVGPGGPFSLADPDDLEKRARGAGFASVQVTTVDSVKSFADVDEHVDVVRTLSPQLNGALADATPAQLAAVRETVAGLDAQYASKDGLLLPSRALLCLALV